MPFLLITYGERHIASSLAGILVAAGDLHRAARTLPITAPKAQAVGALVLLGAGGTGIAFLIFYTLIAGIGPSRAALVAYIAPGFALAY